MDVDFWQERWQKGETGFHQTSPNAYLAYFYGEKGPALDKRSTLKVFVPLCGKSMDLQWLSQNGYGVVGIECSPLAVKDFVKEYGTSIEEVKNDRHIRYTINKESADNQNIDLILGDFFELTHSDLEGVTDVFDRASLIALPPAMRMSYVEKMSDLLSQGVRALLITLSYPQHEMEGPPFSVTEEEVNALYGKNFKIEKILKKDILADEQRFRERGLTSLVETAYKLTRL